MTDGGRLLPYAGWALYALLLAGFPWLPGTALAWAGVAWILVLGWRLATRSGAEGRRTDPRELAIGLLTERSLLAGWWPPIHLLTAAGGVRSPLIGLAVAWIVLVAHRSEPRAGGAAVLGATGALALGMLLRGGAGLTDFLAIFLTAGAGYGTGRLLAGTGEAGSAQPGPQRARTAPDPPGQLEAPQETVGRGSAEDPDLGWSEPLPGESLSRTLGRLAQRLGSRRVVLWEIDREAVRAVARVAAPGALPQSVPLAGDPLGWAASEDQPLRIQPAPPWAKPSSLVGLAPLGPGAHGPLILSAEFEGDGADAGQLEDAASHVRALIRMGWREALANDRETLFGAALTLLTALSARAELARLGQDLAAAARELAAGTGSIVVLRDGSSGAVLARSGMDGGPTEAGPEVEDESEIALAIAAGTTLRRGGEERPARLPLAHSEERWHARPVELVAVPLPDATGTPIGAIAVWCSSGSLDPDGVRVLESLAPVAASQLGTARAMEDLRSAARTVDMQIKPDAPTI